MSYFRFPHISELSFTQGRRRRAFWPSPLNHTQRSESFIIVTIISISLTHKSCDKSTHISFCDNMHDQCREAPQPQLFLAVWLHRFLTSVLWISKPAISQQEFNAFRSRFSVSCQFFIFLTFCMPFLKTLTHNPLLLWHTEY